MDAVLTLFEGMITSIEGKLRNTQLPKSKPLSPLFEAVSNSIHAIEDANRGKGNIEIFLERDNTNLFPGDLLTPIKNILIADTGIGFDTDNFLSFHTAESTHKINRGAKGVGRFIWLKAFNHAKIESYFTENNTIKLRKFDFVPRSNGVENEVIEDISQNKFGTKVHLMELNKGLVKSFPRDIEEIASELMYHFMISFLMPNCPNIVIKDIDNDVAIRLNEKFQAEINPLADKRTFKIKDNRFELIIVRNFGSAAKNNTISYCANYRSVKTINLKNDIVDLSGVISDGDGKKYVYQCYVTGKYLDENVNPERTELTLIDSQNDDSIGFDISFSEIHNRILVSIEDVLSDFLTERRKEKEKMVIRIIEHDLPQYKVVLKHSTNFINNLSPNNLTKDRLDVELYKEFQKIDSSNREKTKKILNDKLEDITDWDDYKKVMSEYIETENEFGKSQLARYIAHRKTILDLLDKYLGISEDGKYVLEELIHNMIFPIRQENDTITYDKQNLWIIDERLAYHSYLASDKRLGKVNSNKSSRPDLLIYQTRFALVSDKEPYQSVVIVEFKRPERDDYTNNEEDNPFDQVIRYVRELRSGHMKDRRGKTINLQENTPFYAYVVCDLTPTLRDVAVDKDFIPTPDNLGFYSYHKNHKVYIEFISYRKLLRDANERNRILFEKLSLPM